MFHRVSQKEAIKQLSLLKRYGKKMRLAADDWGSTFQTLIAIIMSARTRDEVTIEVAKRLFGKYPTAHSLSRASKKDIESIVRPVNFYRNKAQSIYACAQKLEKEFKGIPPHDVELLVTFPGVGRKTANVFLAQYGVDAIGVDTHVSYIAQKLGWTKQHDAKKIEQDLADLFPKRLWRVVNMTCVRFGKTYMSRKKKDVILEEICSR